ncbi:MAG: TRAP transporter small permease [Deltaproteobacteria bacterium]|nr:TRAP transporter small permease [Deltaproteobacteria bacterium]
MLKILDFFEKLLVGWFILASALLAFLLVVLRYFFGRGLTWGSEMVIVLMVWAAFFGAGIAIREKSHIELEVVRDQLPPAFRLPVIVLADLLCVALMLFIMIFGAKWTLFLYHSEGINVATQIPEWILFLCVPLAGLTMLIRYLQHFVENFKKMFGYFRKAG